MLTRPSPGDSTLRAWTSSRAAVTGLSLLVLLALGVLVLDRLSGGWVAENALPLASLTVGLTALGLSMYSTWSVRMRDARMQVVTLEGMFSAVFAELPDKVEEVPYGEYTASQKNAAFRYWHLAHTEWAATKQSHSHDLQRMWHTYYGPVQVSAFQHPGLEEALRRRIVNDTVLRGAWQDYLADLASVLGSQARPWLTDAIGSVAAAT